MLSRLAAAHVILTRCRTTTLGLTGEFARRDVIGARFGWCCMRCSSGGGCGSTGFDGVREGREEACGVDGGCDGGVS